MQHRDDRRRLVGVSVAAVVAVTALAGCGSPSGTLADQAASGFSAVESAQLVVGIDRAGRSTYGVTGSALTDALRELTDATGTTAELDPANDGESRLRAETLAALRAGTDAVNRAREAMHGVGSLGGASAELEHAASLLDRLAARGGAR